MAKNNLTDYFGTAQAGSELVVLKSYRGLVLLSKPCSDCGIMLIRKKVSHEDVAPMRSLRNNEQFPASLQTQSRWDWEQAALLAWGRVSPTAPDHGEQVEGIRRQLDWIGVVSRAARDIVNGWAVYPRGGELVCTASYQGLTMEGPLCPTCGLSFHVSKIRPDDIVSVRRVAGEDKLRRSGSAAIISPGIDLKALAWPTPQRSSP